MKRLLLLVLLAGTINANEIKYDCGAVGFFPKSTLEEALLFTIYVNEKKTMTVYDGYNRKMSTSKYYQTINAKDITERFVELSTSLPTQSFKNFKQKIDSSNIIFDKYIDRNTGNYWLFERFKKNGYNNVGFILKRKKVQNGKQFIHIMCGPRNGN